MRAGIDGDQLHVVEQRRQTRRGLFVAEDSVFRAVDDEERPFDRDRADFSPSTREKHALHEIYQSVMLRVDEYGTTAAAVTTSVRLQTSGRQLEKVAVDSPFLFLLRENNSGLLLLLGRVGDPRSSN